MRLDIKEHALADGEGAANRDETAPFAPGDLAASEAWQRITSDDPDLRMPPPDSNKNLTSSQIQQIRQWIEQGATWAEHWSFDSPQRAELPRVNNTQWPNNAVDYFTLARLEREGLQPSSSADRRTLARRLTFDLTGLPPSPADVLRFVNDTSPKAYEKLVDRLLSSRHYGERMALMWLDAARYGDTSVYHADGPRDMWAWRDWVVDAYNRNLSFDRFSTYQLAGDLLPNATIQQQVASGFNRNNGTTDEGGAIAEEYRVEYAVDRVKTTSTVWLGLTMECGQCHDHKYDPITQEEYYRFFAFFNVSADGGMQSRKGNATPVVNVLDPRHQRQLPEVRTELAKLSETVALHRQSIMPALHAWIANQEEAAREGRAEETVSNPALEFKLDEGKGRRVAVGGSMVEGKKAAAKGRLKGPASWTAGRFGQAIQFDGKTIVDAGDVADFERTDSFSYGGWLRLQTKSSGGFVARLDDNNGFRGYDIFISSRHIEVHIIHKWPDNAIKVRTTKPVSPDAWHHVFVTYDGSSKAQGVTIYVDGEPWEWKIERDALSDTIHTDKPLFLGGRNGSGRLLGTVDQVLLFDRTLSMPEVQTLARANPLLPILATAAADRTPQQNQTLEDYYLRNEDAKHQQLVKQQQQLKARETELLKPFTTVMVMNNMARPRDTFILNRGSYDSPTKRKVQAGTPSVLPAMPSDAPRNRLGLARWLFQADHPLTARVAVNRYWQLLFGAGLVTTPEDLGSQGEFPSHPELLDWLAVDFRESGWDVKRMIKQIVMSATYRQSSRVTPELLERDPGNRLLTRGARFRLQGEFIRDNALAVSGLLVDEPGGPGVKPYQPPGLWREVGLGGNPRFVQDHGDKLYRRSLYTYWKRSAPPPSMQIFDAPTREKCAVRRPRTNTPLQALVTLNDVQFVEAARRLAERILLEGGATPQTRLDLAYRLVVARTPRESERKVLDDVLQHSLTHYRAAKPAAVELVSAGESPRDESLDVVEHAAWTVVAGMLLNLDETLTRQ